MPAGDPICVGCKQYHQHCRCHEIVSGIVADMRQQLDRSQAVFDHIKQPAWKAHDNTLGWFRDGILLEAGNLKHGGSQTLLGGIGQSHFKDWSFWRKPRGRSAEKAVESVQAANDLNRQSDMEMDHTLVRDGLTPVRCQIMTRGKARKLNAANRQYGLKLEWVAGRAKNL